MQLSNGSEREIYEKIKRELTDLPGEKAHLEMYPKRGSSQQHKLETKDYKTSAVLTLLYVENGILHSILTERQSYDGKHSGQMSLPGGKVEDQDDSLEHTALRETEEELGIIKDQVEIIGQLTEVFIPVSKFLVHPFIGVINEKPLIYPNEREVKSVIQFPMDELLHHQNLITTNIKIDEGVVLKDVPAFTIQDKIVWGATALILNEFRTILLRD